MKYCSRLLKAALLAGVLAAPPSTPAALDEAIWKAQLKGSLGIQEFGDNVVPRLQTAGLNTRSALRIILGRDASRNETLALNVDMRNGATNLFLSVYDRVTRSSFPRITANEVTTVMSDGKNFTFTLSADVRSGGRLRLAGNGKIVRGVPAAFKSTVSGLLVDPNPADLGGTTGIVLRATIRTSNLLRP